MTPQTLDYLGRRLPTFDRVAQAPMGHSPLRRPGSVRRTMSIETVWPDGRSGNGAYFGRARDIVTPRAEAAPIVLVEDVIHAIADSRTLVSVKSDPPRPELLRLAGARAGGHLRASIERTLPDQKKAGSPLYLLLDDMAGATLVSGWAFSRWAEDWMSALTEEERLARIQKMEGVCIGFRPGSGALDLDQQNRKNAMPVSLLPHPDDPMGWHELIERGGVNFRRARRIDIWREDGLIRIDSAFQDSASTPQGDRVAIHEYHIGATADPDAQTLLSVEATPGILPFRECQAAPVNLPALLGTPMSELRLTVLTELKKTAGCTHLNDALRALAEVPVLVRSLPAECL